MLLIPLTSLNFAEKISAIALHRNRAEDPSNNPAVPYRRRSQKSISTFEWSIVNATLFQAVYTDERAVKPGNTWISVFTIRESTNTE